MQKESIYKLLPILTVFALACHPEEDSTESNTQNDHVGATMEPIIGGTLASEYPEAALLNMVANNGAQYACSAALIAPKVVLTAGHCVDGMKSWSVVVNGAMRTAIGAETFDWQENGSSSVNPAHHDIGLVYLSSPISLASYPTIAQSPLTNGSPATDVGRILNGQITNQLWKASINVQNGSAVGFPYDYYSPDVIEHGDSGGPVFQAGTHNIIAVNSGAGSGLQVVARVDLLAAWIAQKIAANGGSNNTSDSTAGTTPPSTGGTTMSPSPSTPTCTRESESNNTTSTANTLDTHECGTLTGSVDQDWFKFALRGGTTTTLKLTTSGDATYALGYLMGSTCAVVLQNAKEVRISISGTGSVNFCMMVTTRTNASQAYTIDR